MQPLRTSVFNDHLLPKLEPEVDQMALQHFKKSFPFLFTASCWQEDC